MTVIKFTDDKNNPIGTPRPPSSTSKVLNGKLRYSTKNNLPETGDKDTLYFTTDTHEFYRGMGGAKKVEAFNSLLIFDGFDEFPAEGIATKVYVDRASHALFFYGADGYQQIGTGGGGGVVPGKDERIGDLSKLETVEKRTIVGAINEIFNKLKVMDFTTLQDAIDVVEASVEKITTDFTNLTATVDGVKTSVEANTGAINRIDGTVNQLSTEVEGFDDRIVLTEQKASTAVTDVEKLKVIVDGLDKVDLTPYAKKADVYTKGEVDALIPNTNDFALKSEVVTLGNELNALEEVVDNLAAGGNVDLTAYAKKADVYGKELTYTKQEVDALIPAPVDISGLATKQSVKDVDAKVDADKLLITKLRTDVDGLVTITTAEKAKYDGYEAMIQALQDPAAFNALVARVAKLEEFHKDPPTEPEPPVDPPEPGTIEWTHEFTLPVGVPTFDLQADPNWIAKGKTLDIYEDVYGDVPKTALYFTGVIGGLQYPEGKLVPAVGIDDESLVAPNDNGKWQMDDNNFIYFEASMLAATTYRLVKMA